MLAQNLFLQFSRNIRCSRLLGMIQTNERFFSELHQRTESKDLYTLYNKHESVINKVCSQYPALKSVDKIHKWETFIKILKDFAFTESDCFHIISMDPQVLSKPPNDLRLILTRWHTSQLGGDFVNLLIMNNPSYLFVPIPTIDKRLPILVALAKKPKVLLPLLIQCPNVMSEQWEHLQAKIDYLVNEMRVERSEILKCRALSHSLEHIKLRHQLILKCGMYVAPSPYEHKRVKNEKAAFINPPLKRIVDNEDVAFARKICKISHEEYEAFSEMFSDELRKEEEEELNSDSDSDSDS